MAGNTGGGHRKGAVKNRSQTHNPKNNTFVKRDESGRFVGAKKTAYKGVKKEANAKAKVKSTSTAKKTTGKNLK